MDSHHDDSLIVERFIPDSVIVSAIIANPSLMDKHYKCACKSQLAYVYRSPALTNKLPGVTIDFACSTQMHWHPHTLEID